MNGAVQAHCNEIHLLCFMFTTKPVSGVLRTGHITNISLAQRLFPLLFHLLLLIVSGLETVEISPHPLIADQICLVSSALHH